MVCSYFGKTGATSDCGGFTLFGKCYPGGNYSPSVAGGLNSAPACAPVVHCTRILLDCLRTMGRSRPGTMSRGLLSLAVGSVHSHIGLIKVGGASMTARRLIHRTIHGREHIRLTFRKLQCCSILH